MKLYPCSLREANAFVSLHHRHSVKSVGHKYSVMVKDDNGVTLGAGIASRPRARLLDDGVTLEIIRVTTLGGENVCSMIYGGLRRAAIALGYTRVITYIRCDENGSSVRAAGFHFDADTRGMREWNTPSRPREMADYETVDRKRYIWP